MGGKIEVKESENKDFNFAKQFLRPRQSGAHGTCHACHTLDTPLPPVLQDRQNILYCFLQTSTSELKSQTVHWWMFHQNYNQRELKRQDRLPLLRCETEHRFKPAACWFDLDKFISCAVFIDWRLLWLLPASTICLVDVFYKRKKTMNIFVLTLRQWCSNFLARGPHLSFRNPSRATRINNRNKNSLKNSLLWLKC